MLMRGCNEDNGSVDVKAVDVNAVAVKAVAANAVDANSTIGDAFVRMAAYLEEKSLRTRFAENLRFQRTLKGVSQEGLADLVGLHRTFVSKVERAVTSVSMDNIEKLARALNVDPVELFRPIDEEDAGLLKKPLREPRGS